MKRRDFLRLSAAGLMSPAAGTLAAAQDSSRPPNILLIMADDVGQEVLGCYGGESYPTPYLDGLARHGMRFEHCYSMPVCHPTRVALLTGRYPFRLGNPGWGSFPRPEESHTWGHAMKRAGYATAIAGKWQLALLKNDPEHPHRLGFDEYSLFGWHEGPRYYDPLIWQNGTIRDDGKGRYGPEVYTDFLIDFMQRHRQQPFVAYYSMALCHDVTDDLDHHVPFGPGKDRYDSYAEMAESMDRMVGKLIAALRRLRLQERTLVLFTGDNGTAKSSIARVEGGRLTRDPVFSLRNGVEIRGGKGELTDGGTRVPLIANWPGTIPAGQVVHDLVDFSDFFPTLADIGGAALPDDVTLDGRSFASRLRGTGPAPRPWAFCESGNNYWARTQRWKLLNDGRLIDMEADPREKQPIRPAADTAESAAARRQLLQAFDQLGLKPERASDG